MTGVVFVSIADARLMPPLRMARCCEMSHWSLVRTYFNIRSLMRLEVDSRTSSHILFQGGKGRGPNGAARGRHARHVGSRSTMLLVPCSA